MVLVPILDYNSQDPFGKCWLLRASITGIEVYSVDMPLGLDVGSKSLLTGHRTLCSSWMLPEM